jgi:hypothetical protein
MPRRAGRRLHARLTRCHAGRRGGFCARVVVSLGDDASLGAGFAPSSVCAIANITTISPPAASTTMATRATKVTVSFTSQTQGVASGRGAERVVDVRELLAAAPTIAARPTDAA